LYTAAIEGGKLVWRAAVMRTSKDQSATRPVISDCGLRTADCGLRIADCGLRIGWMIQSAIESAFRNPRSGSTSALPP